MAVRRKKIVSNPKFSDVENIWSKLKIAYIAYIESVQRQALEEVQGTLLDRYLAAMSDFLSGNIDRVRLLKVKLRSPDAKIAVVVLDHLSGSELSELFDELVFLAASTHWAVQRARAAILRLPWEWVLARIEANAEPLLASGTYDEYRRLLELYALLDPMLTQRLAERAIQHPDLDVQEAGHDFLK